MIQGMMIAFAVLVALPGAEAEVMNNLDIFRMVREKTPTEAIIAKVRQCGSDCDFVLLPENVAMLTREGVPPEVIQAMREAKPGPSMEFLTAAAADSAKEQKKEQKKPECTSCIPAIQAKKEAKRQEREDKKRVREAKKQQMRLECLALREIPRSQLTTTQLSTLNWCEDNWLLWGRRGVDELPELRH